MESLVQLIMSILSTVKIIYPASGEKEVSYSRVSNRSIISHPHIGFLEKY